MRNTFTRALSVASLSLLSLAPIATYAQRPMENFSRGLIARRVSNGYLVQWRINSDEWRIASYKLYRDGELIYESGISGASNFLDKSGTNASVYTVSTVINGVESEAKGAISKPLTKDYLEIKLRDLPEGKTGYHINDCTAADLDGDGEMEIIVKRLNTDWSTTNTSYTYFEAYKLDGTFMWAIDVGPNITMDVEINIAAFDLDGDGKAEVFMRSSDNTIFGDGTSVGDRDGDGVTNYRYSIGGDGFMNAGPEYLSLIDGVTGAEIDWVNFIPRGQSSDWGDNYGHRANKFFFGAPYLDGVHPSLFIGRGIYTQTLMKTYDVVNKKLVERWSWDSRTEPGYSYQGNHNFTIADTDGDGYDEIVWGSMCVDHDGKGLYTTELGHGDAMHVGDFDPYYKGIEVFACNEDKPGTNLRDGKTGKLLIRHITPSDCGRCGAGNITDKYRGYEVWGGGVGHSATDREQLGHFGVAENYTIYWDGDLLKEILDHKGFSSNQGYGLGHITKFYDYGDIRDLLVAEAASCNWTKGTPCLQADLFGDWREEVIWRKTDNSALYIYLTPYETEERIYTLLHDHQYRQAICWQMCGYNQPPHISFYLGGEFPDAIPAKSTNGKLVWKGESGKWDMSAQEWMNGSELKGLIDGTGATYAFSNNQQVLLSPQGKNRNIELASDVNPSVLTVSDIDDYSISGNGKLTGDMMLDKMGEGKLSIAGTHDFEGECNVWEGTLSLDGTYSNFPVVVRRHANLLLNGIFNNDITTEYNATIALGTDKTSNKALVKKNIWLCEGARLAFDIRDNALDPSAINMIPANSENDILEVEGTLYVEEKSFIVLNTEGKLEPGLYYIGNINSINGNISGIKLDGTKGAVAQLIHNAETKALFVRIIGIRDAAKVTWTGRENGNWDYALSLNWNNDDIEDIYVNGDDVTFGLNSDQRNINIPEVVTPKSMTVNDGTYTFGGAGSLDGDMSLSVVNGANVTITNRNNFTGKVTVDNSALTVTHTPSPTNNGGIGAANTDPAYFVLKDSATLRVTNDNEILQRSITLSGVKGGIIYNDKNFYVDAGASFKGTKLTKRGSGWLYLESNNTDLTETEIDGGTIKLNTWEAYPYGVGKTVTLRGGGTLETYNYAGGSGVTMSSNFVVPEGASGKIVAFPRATYTGSLTGGGNLTWVVDMIRCYMNGNWSAFDGKISLTKNSANSTYEDHFIVNNSYGYPNAEINIANDIKFIYNNWAGTTIKVGALSGSANAMVESALEVGNKNINTTYAGIISGSFPFKKVGTGEQTLSGKLSYTGATTITGGTLAITGTKSGTGTYTVSSGATLCIDGTSTGAITLNANIGGVGGTLSGAGTVEGNVTANNGAVISPAGVDKIGTLTVNGNVTMRAGAVMEANLGIRGIPQFDKMVVNGKMTCAGILRCSTISTPRYSSNLKFQIISADEISGSFSEIILPEIPEIYSWDTSSLYNDGCIYLVDAQLNSIEGNSFKTGVLDNETDGIYNVAFENADQKVTMKVFNQTGKLIVDRVVMNPSGIETIDIRDSEKGIYMLYIKPENGKTETFKLIKE